MSTVYHAAYFAHELTKRSSSDSIEKLAGAVAGAQVDLNPHQVAAALFAFNSPLSKGALLADEVGLGKTIEAGLVMSQHWAERRRRMLVIPKAVLARCEWGHDDYSLQVENLPKAPPPPPAVDKRGQQSLFGEGVGK